uniref:protein-serine/threonine phosphatase n=2 Tax=Aegilops tauschii subsp. strangulata TaxID=200361 RepID=A0A453S5N4_AEGTS
SCGYSSFKGRRPTMEDRYDVKFAKMKGQSVSLFGVFDGHAGALAAEYLKEHLLDNLIKHPQFLRNPKLALSNVFFLLFTMPSCVVRPFPVPYHTYLITVDYF